MRSVGKFRFLGKKKPRLAFVSLTQEAEFPIRDINTRFVNVSVQSGQLF